MIGFCRWIYIYYVYKPSLSNHSYVKWTKEGGVQTVHRDYFWPCPQSWLQTLRFAQRVRQVHPGLNPASRFGQWALCESTFVRAPGSPGSPGRPKKFSSKAPYRAKLPGSAAPYACFPGVYRKLRYIYASILHTCIYKYLICMYTCEYYVCICNYA